MTTPHKCPCCDGWGKRGERGSTVQDLRPACHACRGSGLVWSPQDDLKPPQEGSTLTDSALASIDALFRGYPDTCDCSVCRKAVGVSLG